MANTELLVKLRALHEDLASINDDLDSTNQIDEPTIDALGDLVTDISELIDHTKSATTRGLSNHEHQDFLDRVMEFEASHPRVTQFLSQVTDMLAMMGI